MNIDFSHEHNTNLINYLLLSDGPKLLSSDQLGCSPETVNMPYINLGTHPDIVKRLWDEITVLLPAKSSWVICGKPALAHPQSGIIFGFATGSLTYALRLSPITFEHALQKGAQRIWHYTATSERGAAASTLNLAELGDGWIFGGWWPEEIDWCLSAYDFAGH